MAMPANGYVRLGNSTNSFVSDSADSCYQAGLEFLRTDIDVGMTFAGIALRSTDPNKVSRNTLNARKAYDTVSQFLNRLPFSSPETTEISLNLVKLQKALELLDNRSLERF